MSTFVKVVLTLALLVSAATVGSGQQLKNIGMLATGTMSRTRLGGANFQLGDMMYVKAHHPANSGKMYVSAHMEYHNPQRGWLAVPTAVTPLGKSYKSSHYPGLRDYVRFEGSSSTLTRHICLFMPYDAAGLSGGETYKRRYVIRVWDNNNKEIANTVLPSENVHTERHNGRLVLTIVKTRTCASIVDPGNMEPVAESKDTGSVRFFSTDNGEWICK